MKYNKPKNIKKPKVRIVPPIGENPYKGVDRWSEKDYPRNIYRKPNEKKSKRKQSNI